MSGTPETPTQSTLYFHGLPGSAAELTIAGWAESSRPTVMPPLSRTLPDDDCHYHLIGFSGGAMSALQLAAEVPNRIIQISLISPLTPLELGDFLPIMSAGPMFMQARDDKAGFEASIQNMAALAATAPRDLLNALFAGTPPSEAALLDDPVIADAFCEMVDSGVGKSGQGDFLTAIQAALRPWANILPEITCPVTIFQGRDDVRTPLVMAEALSAAIGSNAALEIIDGVGHYGALRYFAAHRAAAYSAAKSRTCTTGT